MYHTHTILSPDGLLELSSEELHATIVKLHRVKCAVRRVFMDALLVLDERRAFLELGFSSVYQYSERFFGYQKTATAELLRVARSLRGLPGLARAADDGALAYSKLQEVTRVATRETEAEWLQFAQGASVKAVQLEVRDAVEKGRAHPRKAGGGLPNLTVRWVLEMTREELELLRTALRKARGELEEGLGGLGGGAVSEKQAILFLARRMLETDPAGTPEGRVERQDSIYTLVYGSCPSCKRAHLKTPDGPVEVSPEAAALRRRVLARDGHCCARPGCGRRLGLQCHHVRPRSEGGATAEHNLLAVCGTCHALLHQGLLSVSVDSAGEVRWRATAEQIDVRWESRLLELLETPAQAPQVQNLSSDGAASGPRGQEAQLARDALRVLTEFVGLPRQAAAKAMTATLQSLRQTGRPLTLDGLVNAAIARTRERNGAMRAKAGIVEP